MCGAPCYRWPLQQSHLSSECWPFPSCMTWVDYFRFKLSNTSQTWLTGNHSYYCRSVRPVQRACVSALLFSVWQESPVHILLHDIWCWGKRRRAAHHLCSLGHAERGLPRSQQNNRWILLQWQEFLRIRWSSCILQLQVRNSAHNQVHYRCQPQRQFTIYECHDSLWHERWLLEQPRVRRVQWLAPSRRRAGHLPGPPWTHDRNDAVPGKCFSPWVVLFLSDESYHWMNTLQDINSTISKLVSETLLSLESSASIGIKFLFCLIIEWCTGKIIFSYNIYFIKLITLTSLFIFVMKINRNFDLL